MPTTDTRFRRLRTPAELAQAAAVLTELGYTKGEDGVWTKPKTIAEMHADKHEDGRTGWQVYLDGLGPMPRGDGNAPTCPECKSTSYHTPLCSVNR